MEGVDNQEILRFNAKLGGYSRPNRGQDAMPSRTPVPATSTPPAPDFAFVGGRLCLDFVNTLRGRLSSEPVETVECYEDLLRWSVAAGDLDRERADTLGALAASDPTSAAAVLRRALELRETLVGIFKAVTSRRRPSAAELEAVNSELARISPHLCCLRWSGAQPELGWSTALTLDRPLWNVLRSAIDLLVSDQRELIKQCEASGCSWFFVDETRNHSRRWCEMSSCGNRAKARRSRSRKKGAAGSSGRR